MMTTAVWLITVLSLAGIIIRPLGLPEAIWAAIGAAVLVILGCLTPDQAFAAIMKGADVYLFLAGMLLLSELARHEGLFDWAAERAVVAARGSAKRLFLLVYVVGIIVTTFLSNDATAVVLTPAVLAAARRARADQMPLLFICAFVANAASFVLPISNPANIVLFGDHTPPLAQWLSRFALPSLLAILATYVALRFSQRRALEGGCATEVSETVLQPGGMAALVGLGITAIVLMVFSWLGVGLGLPTAVLGVVTTALVLAGRRRSPIPLLREISWSVLPLVAGLFVIVEALERVGAVAHLSAALAGGEHPVLSGAVAGGVLAIGTNLVNNLPLGLLASSAIAAAPTSSSATDALLIGVDLGPNLSLTGSLATILWLSAIRRDGGSVGFWQFFRIGSLVMPPALILALAARLA